MRRTLAGIIAGIGLAIAVMVAIEAVGNQLYPPPMGMNLEQPGAAARMPFATLIFPVLGWLAGPFAGGSAAVILSRDRRAAWPVGGAVLVGALLQFALARHPLWMIVAGLAAPLAGAWLAQRLAGRRSGSEQGEASAAD